MIEYENLIDDSDRVDTKQSDSQVSSDAEDKKSESSFESASHDKIEDYHGNLKREIQEIDLKHGLAYQEITDKMIKIQAELTGKLRSIEDKYEETFTSITERFQSISTQIVSMKAELHEIEAFFSPTVVTIPEPLAPVDEELQVKEGEPSTPTEPPMRANFSSPPVVRRPLPRQSIAGWSEERKRKNMSVKSVVDSLEKGRR